MLNYPVTVISKQFYFFLMNRFQYQIENYFIVYFKENISLDTKCYILIQCLAHGTASFYDIGFWIVPYGSVTESYWMYI